MALVVWVVNHMGSAYEVRTRMAAEGPLVQFGPFTFDPRTGSLWQGTVLLPSQPKDAAVLQVLLQHAGQVVSREILLEARWPDTFVTDTVLKNRLNRLRDSWEIVPRRGALSRPGAAGVTALSATLPGRQGYQASPGLTRQSKWRRPSALLHPRSSFRNPVFLVGREAEWHQLSEWCRLALTGVRQVVVACPGEPGMGGDWPW